MCDSRKSTMGHGQSSRSSRTRTDCPGLLCMDTCCRHFPSVTRTVLLCFLSLVLHSVTWGMDIQSSMDPPVIQPGGLKEFQIDRSVDKYYYRRLIKDVEDDEYLYGGAMDHIFRLDLDDISNSNKKTTQLGTNIEQIEENADNCKKEEKEDTSSPNYIPQCNNHIRIVVVNGSEIYTCGTGGLSPQELILDRELKVIDETSKNSGVGKCPYKPGDNATWIFSRTGNPGAQETLISATVMDARSYMPVIHRTEIVVTKVNGDGETVTERVSHLLRNAAIWLYDPDFVKALEFEDYVYLFFRELASEESQKGIVSRVARFCKKDVGGPPGYEKDWCTFLKARLVCSIPGIYDFDFDEIQDVWQDGSIVYALFTSHANHVYGSAVCSYTMDQIQEAFNGSFRKKDTCGDGPDAIVEEEYVPSPRPGQCPQNGLTTQNLTTSTVKFIHDHPLMYDSVVSEPLFYLRDKVLMRLVLDKKDGYNILFMTSDDGEVHQVSQWVNQDTVHSRHLAIYTPFAPSMLPIWQLILWGDYLYMSSDEKVVQFPTKQCDKYTVCDKCVVNPYCAWYNDRCSEDKFGVGARNVETPDAVTVCNNEDLCKGGKSETHVLRKHRDGDREVAIQENPVHMTCDAKCTTTHGVQWRFQRSGETSWSVVETDAKNVFVTRENGLVLWNASLEDAGKYRCWTNAPYEDAGSTPDIFLAEHTLEISDCPSNDERCIWEKEFQSWCNAYYEYTQEVNHWKCLKEQCVESECVPDDIHEHCPMPSV